MIRSKLGYDIVRINNGHRSLGLLGVAKATICPEVGRHLDRTPTGNNHHDCLLERGAELVRTPDSCLWNSSVTATLTSGLRDLPLAM